MDDYKPVAALLIDADNVKVELVADVIARLQATHVLQHRRAYGSVQKAVEFGTLAQDHAIRFLPSTFAGPNATDLALAIDAVELVLRHPVDEVVLVSSDRDFAPLVVRLRELGCRVSGFGQAGKTAGDIGRDYLRVYDAYEVIGLEKKKPAKAAKARKKAAPKPAPKPALPQPVLEVLDTCPELKDGKAVQLNSVVDQLRERKLLSRSGKVSAFFKKLDGHFELQPPDKPTTVRFLG